MKKTLTMLGAAVLLLAGCHKKPATEFDVTLTLPSEFKGRTVLLHSALADDTLAMAQLEDSVITLTGNVEKPVLAFISVNNMPVGDLVVEPGSIVWTEDSVSGTPLNNEVTAFQNAAMEEDADVPSMAESFVKDHPANPYSYALIAQLGPLMSAETLEAFVAANPDMASDEVITSSLNYAKVRAATSDGNAYIDFSGKDAAGKEVKLSSYVGRAKYTVLDFWAPWCKPCCREIPNLEALYEKYKARGLEVVGAEVWRRPGAPEAAAKAKELGVTYPVMYDVAQDVTEKYGIFGIPCVMVIDREGTILRRDIVGEELDAYIATLF